MAKNGRAEQSKIDLAAEVRAVEPHDALDYDQFKLESGIRAPFGNDSPSQTGQRNFTNFVQVIERFGGVPTFLKATNDQLAGGRDGLYTSYGLHNTFAAGAPVSHIIPSYTNRTFQALRYRRYFVGPALLLTLAYHEGEDDPAFWPLHKIAQGYTYDDVSTALQMKQATLIDLLMTITTAEKMKAAWSARQANIMARADGLVLDALDADFDDVAEAAKAESRAKVLNTLSSHMKFNASALIEAYKPAAGNIAVTPGAINISFTRPQD